MNFSSHKIPYRSTNTFSKIVLDYLDAAPTLDNFYNYKPDIEGIKKAVADRKFFPVNRKLLVDTFTKQYASLETSNKLKDNIALLSSENTFTICTAHQPNIFTGHLYFVYKILHAIKLAEVLKAAMPQKNFVPVYYMGSEDADLDELGEVFIKGYAYKWQTEQKGAVGKMIIDDAFLHIIDCIEGQLAVEENAREILIAIRDCYKKGITISEATFHFVHYLFGKYGLLILQPDDKDLKNEFLKIAKKELEEQFSEKAVTAAIAEFPKEYKVQAAGRSVNLFYLKDNVRERIEKIKDDFIVANTSKHFSKVEIIDEFKNHPERCSPNVILRPVFQEIILPNVAFIGGGGELAYWLELKKVFEAANIFFPVLLLRNSFTIINKTIADKIKNIGYENEDIFKTEKQFVKEIVNRESSNKLDLIGEKEALKIAYENIKLATSKIDTTLSAHVYALRTKALNKLEIVEKKMFKAEKKKFEAQQRQIKKIKTLLFPNENLQERVDNILEYLSIYGIEFLDILLQHSNGLEAEFTIIAEK